MATVGQQLLSPETGWTRVNDTDSRLVYSSGWLLDASVSGSYRGNYHYTNLVNATMSFSFNGTGLRFVGAIHPNRSNNITVIIDGISYPSSEYGSSYQLQTLWFEKIDLSDTRHDVVLKLNNNAYLDLDAIDIYTPPKTTLANCMSLGDKIICKYTATSNSFGVFSQLGVSTASLLPASAVSNPDGSFFLTLVGWDSLGRKKFVADRNIQSSISWDTLNTSGVSSASGVPVKIDSLTDVIVRLPSGGWDNSSKENEWDKYITESTLGGLIVPGDIVFWNLGSFYCITSSRRNISESLPNYISIRGYGSAGYRDACRTDEVNAIFGFRPLFIDNSPLGFDIVSVSTLSDITVANGTDLTSIILPTVVTVILSNDTAQELAVIWNTSSYNKNIAGSCTFVGELALIEEVLNPSNITASINIIVLAANITSIQSIFESNIFVKYGTDINSLGLLQSTDVLLSNGLTSTLQIVWNSNPTYNPETAGNYVFTGILILPEGIANPSNLKITITVTVKPLGITIQTSTGIIRVAKEKEITSQLGIFSPRIFKGITSGVSIELVKGPRYYCERSTYISSSERLLNFNSDDILKIGSGNHSLFKIPLNKSLGYISKALLKLNVKTIVNNLDIPGRISIYRINNLTDWNEETVTYNSGISYDTSNVLNIFFENEQPGEVVIDITQIIKNIDNSDNDFGFAIYSSDIYLEIDKSEIVMNTEVIPTEIDFPSQIYPNLVYLKWKDVRVPFGTFTKTYVLRSKTELLDFDASKVIFETNNINETEYTDDNPPEKDTHYYYYVYIEQPELNYYFRENAVSAVVKEFVSESDDCSAETNFTISPETTEIISGKIKPKEGSSSIVVFNYENFDWEEFNHLLIECSKDCRFLINTESNLWFKYTYGIFVETDEIINGNTSDELNNMFYEDWNKSWIFNKLNIKIFIPENGFLDRINISYRKNREIVLEKGSPEIYLPIPKNNFRYILQLDNSYELWIMKGLSFDDVQTDYDFYTGPDKVKIRPLDAGNLIGKLYSNIYPVELINSYTNSNFNIRLIVSQNGIAAKKVGDYCLLNDSEIEDQKTKIELSLSGENFRPQYPLNVVLFSGEKKNFYVRIYPTELVSGNSQFQIQAFLEPI